MGSPKKRSFRNRCQAILGGHLATFLHLFGVVVECDFSRIFQWSVFRRFGPIWSSKVSKSEVLGGRFDDIFAVGPTCENRCFV